MTRAAAFLEHELPTEGAHGVAVFSSVLADLFEAIKLPRSVANRVAIGARRSSGPWPGSSGASVGVWRS